MKKLLIWITKHFWWRKYYRLAYITNKEEWRGRCIICEAGGRAKADTPHCNTAQYRDCPCKMNQRLVLKEEYSDFEAPEPKETPVP